MKLKDIILTAVTAMCIFLYFGNVEQERRIDDLESTAGNQSVMLQKQAKEYKLLNDQIDALNVKVDELPK